MNLRRWLRPGAVVLGGSAVVALVVRFVGLLSQGLVSSRFGAGSELDAFFIALLVPGLLVAPIGAAVEAVVSPIYARLLEHAPERARAFKNRVLLAAVLGSTALTVIVTIAAPALARASAPGAGSERHVLSTELALFLYPAILPRLVSSVVAALLFGSGRFQLPVAVRVVNPAAIVVALLLVPTRNIHAVAIASLVGGALELLLLLVALRRHRLAAGPADARDEVRGAMLALRPLILTYALLQASPVIDQAFAGSLGTGDVAKFAIAVRLFDVATSMLILPNARMAMTRLGRAAAGVALDASRLHWEVRRALAVGVISAVLLAAGSPVLVFAVYRHGAFTSSDAWDTIATTAVFAAALVPLSLGYLLPRVLIAIGHARRMLWFSLAQVALNIALDAVLVRPLGARGIAFATVIVYVLIGVAQIRLLDRLVTRRRPVLDPVVVPELEHEERPER